VSTALFLIVVLVIYHLVYISSVQYRGHNHSVLVHFKVLIRVEKLEMSLPDGGGQPYLFIGWLLVNDICTQVSQFQSQDPALSVGESIVYKMATLRTEYSTS
jgi:hypothetical protein